MSNSIDPTGKPTTFSALLNYLFATRRRPDGKEYTLTEVSQATGLRKEYLSNLRTGKITEPPLSRAQLLADFFGVNVGFFTGEYNRSEPLEGTQIESEQDQALREALAQPLVRDVALRAGAKGIAERAIILEMLDRAEEIAKAAEEAERARSQAEARAGEEHPSA
jgi:transcriptional regulator with XRE-family HTH domain